MSTQREITYSIGETSELTGASQRQIRYWENRGFIKSIRNVCGRIAYRRFTQGQVEIIRAIKGHLAQGYTLARAAELAILPRFKDEPIKRITYGDVKNFRSELKVGAKRANNIMVPMKAVFDYAHQEGIIQDNVMRKIKRLTEEAPEIHPFTLDEVNQIIDAVDPWYRPYVSVAFFTGMRAGEQNGLSWSDFLYEMKPEPHIFIHKTYVYKKDSVPKTKKSKRYIKCLPQVLDALVEQRKLTGSKKHIFLTLDGRRMTPDHLRKEVWTPALKKAGIEYRPPIQTRHSFATMMLSVGEDVGWVQNMLGHSSLQMIFQRYYAWIPKQTRSDGQAFIRYAESAATESPQEAEAAVTEKPNSDKGCTNLVPLAEYRQKKGLRIAPKPLILLW